MSSHDRATRSVALIKGQVAEIVDSREVVINRGQRDGVLLGMKFAILSPRGQDIEDPETGESLGSLRLPKVEVEVVRVADRMSVARTFKSARRNVGGMGIGGTGIAALFEPPKYERVFETFKTDERQLEEIDESESYVKIGDPVEEVFEPAEGSVAESSSAGTAA